MHGICLVPNVSSCHAPDFPILVWSFQFFSSIMLLPGALDLGSSASWKNSFLLSPAQIYLLKKVTQHEKMVSVFMLALMSFENVYSSFVIMRLTFLLPLQLHHQFEVNENMFILFDLKDCLFFSTGRNRKYVPRKNSAAYAIVITLYKYDFSVALF